MGERIVRRGETGEERVEGRGRIERKGERRKGRVVEKIER